MNVLFVERRHQKKNCPKLQKNDKGKAISNTCVVEHDAEESDFNLVSMKLTCYLDKWILDSGYTYHMCLNKGQFSNFNKLDSEVMFIVIAFKTMGIDSIQLKNYDGSIQIHVSSLKKNLISLKILKSKGLTITLADEFF